MPSAAQIEKHYADNKFEGVKLILQRELEWLKDPYSACATEATKAERDYAVKRVQNVLDSLYFNGILKETP